MLFHRLTPDAAERESLTERWEHSPRLDVQRDVRTFGDPECHMHVFNVWKADYWCGTILEAQYQFECSRPLTSEVQTNPQMRVLHIDHFSHLEYGSPESASFQT
jgi:hypothetical protein